MVQSLRVIDLSRFSSEDFDRGASRIKEGLWLMVKCLFFCLPIPLPSGLRVLLLRAFGAKVGKGVVLRAGLNVSFPWRLELGDHVWLGEDVAILSLARVTIESHVCISQCAYLCTGSHDYQRDDFALQTQPIVLRRGCWVAAQAFVGPGVEIQSGSVIAAGAVVTKSVEENVLIGGNPARVIRIIDRS